MAWSNPSTVTDGQVLSATRWNAHVVANTEFLARPPSVSLTRTTDLAPGTTAWRSVPWQTEGWDTDTMWSSTAATRIDVNTAGKYQVTATIPFSSASNVKLMGITLGGSTTAAPNSGVVESYGALRRASMSITSLLSMTSTQFVRVQVSADVAPTILHTSVYRPSVSVLWVSS